MATTDTSKYKLNHSMLRVKDPRKSVKYYEFLGLKQIKKLSFPENKFDLYFLAYDGSPPGSPSQDTAAAAAAVHWSDRQGILELTHNYGSEEDDSFKIANGNSDPETKGFSYVSISVDNIQAACRRIEDAGYPFQKKQAEGHTRDTAFALDPDGYWVNIIAQNPVEQTENVKDTDLGTYRLNHTMIRVKDHTASLDFYQRTLGMNLIYTHEIPSAGLNLYYLGYPSSTTTTTTTSTTSPSPSASASASASTTCNIPLHEGLLGLTYHHGTEKQPNFSYHNGNTDPQGFGHICISVDDLDAACARFDGEGVKWKKRLAEGRMKTVAFILDPDGYWVEVIQNERLKKRNDW